MKLLTIIFSFLSLVSMAQTGAINFSVGRSKVTDTSTVVMTGYKGGIRFKDQAGQTKWQFTVNGTTWLDWLASNDGLTTNYIPKAISANVLGNSQIFDNGTRVGIGTASPQEKFHIVGVRASQIIEESGTPTDASLFLGTTSNRQYSGFITDFPNDKFYLRHNSATRVTVNSTGNLGIGTTSPLERLHITGARASQYIEETNGSPVDASLFLGTTSNRQYSGFITDFPNDKFYLRHNSATRMTVDLSGNFGIGTTSPAQKLDVNGTFAVRGGSPGSGKVLTSDSDGDASWTTQVSGASGQVAYFNGANSVTGSANYTFVSGSSPALTIGYQIGSLSNQTATATFSGYNGSTTSSVQAVADGSNATLNIGGAAAKINATGSSSNLTIEATAGAGVDIILDPADDLIVNADNLEVANTIAIRGGSPGSGKVLTSDSDGDAVWSSGYSISSAGIYTPTLTGTSNVSTTTARPCQYMTVGTTVHVGCQMDVDPTSASSATTLRVSLPIASGGFSNSYKLTGTSVSITGGYTSGVLIGDTGSGEASLGFISSSTGTNETLVMTFTYTYIAP